MTDQPGHAGPKRKALGRGLAALLPVAAPPAQHTSIPAVAQPPRDGYVTVGIEQIHPSRYQPRKVFDEARLTELSESIRNQGVIQPLVVRRRDSGGYELIAGERRWRAAQKAGLHEVPVVVREAAPDRLFEMSLVENLQREDLNPIEEAEAFERLITEHGYTQEAVATRVGKDRATVANSLRLLKLPDGVRGMVIAGRLSMGHARALLGLETADRIENLARRVTARDLSVRQVEELVRRERTGTPESSAAPAPSPGSASARDLTERLQRALGLRVKVIETGQGRGRLELHYGSLDELDRVLDRLLPGHG